MSILQKGFPEAKCTDIAPETTQGTRIAENATGVTQQYNADLEENTLTPETNTMRMLTENEASLAMGEQLLQKMADAVGPTTHEVSGKHNKLIFHNTLQIAKDEFT